MTCKIVNKTNQDMSQLTNMAQDLYPYSKERLGFDKPVMVELHSDPQNASNMLGKTAYYDPSSYKIVVYTDNRHPKDILRSLSHELVHHAQNCRGEFDNHRSVGEGYAQANEHLREMEKEAYLEGNMILRDWEDRKKTSKEKTKVNEEKIRELARKVIERLAEERKIKEASKTDSPDRVAGRKEGGRRLTPLEEGGADCATLAQRIRDGIDTVNRYGQGGDIVVRDQKAYEAAGCPPLDGMGNPVKEEVVEETEETNEEVVDEAKQFADDDDLDGDKDGKPKWADPDDPANKSKVKKENKTANQRHNERLFETLIKKWTK